MPKDRPSNAKPRTMDTQNRVIVPAEVIEALDLRPKDQVEFVINDDTIQFYKVERVLAGPKKKSGASAKSV